MHRKEGPPLQGSHGCGLEACRRGQPPVREGEGGGRLCRTPSSAAYGRVLHLQIGVGVDVHLGHPVHAILCLDGHEDANANALLEARLQLADEGRFVDL